MHAAYLQFCLTAGVLLPLQMTTVPSGADAYGKLYAETSSDGVRRYCSAPLRVLQAQASACSASIRSRPMCWHTPCLSIMWSLCAAAGHMRFPC